VCDVCEQMGDLLMQFSLLGGRESLMSVTETCRRASRPSAHQGGRSAAERTGCLIPTDSLQPSPSHRLSTPRLLPRLFSSTGASGSGKKPFLQAWGWELRGERVPRGMVRPFLSLAVGRAAAGASRPCHALQLPGPTGSVLPTKKRQLPWI